MFAIHKKYKLSTVHEYRSMVLNKLNDRILLVNENHAIAADCVKKVEVKQKRRKQKRGHIDYAFLDSILIKLNSLPIHRSEELQKTDIQKYATGIVKFVSS